MADEFLKLSQQEQRDVLTAASARMNMLPAVAEKDVWACFVLNILFSIPERRPMVFKGGTSLSKVFGLIKRFSEDIDISVNFLQDYESPMSSKTKATRIRDEIEPKLQAYKNDVLLPALANEASQFGLTVEPGDSDFEIHVNYPSVLATGIEYIKTRVKIELSGRNETEPSKQVTIRPYLAEQTEGLIFPEASIDALLAERTFWEKVTLIHAGINSGEIEVSAERMSRHWSDVALLMKTDTGERAMADRELCLRVVNHKDSFWRDGKAKYDDCRNKKFKLVPTGKALELLRADYEAMLDAGMFFDERPAKFEEIVRDIGILETRLNS